MNDRIITEEIVVKFSDYLIHEEKTKATCEKYVRDVKKFMCFVGEEEVTKEIVAKYKKKCIENGYAIRSINSMIASINSFLVFQGWHECRVKSIKVQHQIFCAEEKELTKAEYIRLLEASKNDRQMNLILQSMGGTGVRVSELKHFTVEAIRKGTITIHGKGKVRAILIPGKLQKLLLDFAKKRGIKKGAIFLTKNKKHLDRSNIWKKMKRLCEIAKVKKSKVFPHNLRKLFARTFYKFQKDIAKLADVLGHSSINTTRIYIMDTGTEHRRLIDRLELVI